MKAHIYEQLTKLSIEDVVAEVTLLQLLDTLPLKIKRNRFELSQQIVYLDEPLLQLLDILPPKFKKNKFKLQEQFITEDIPVEVTLIQVPITLPLSIKKNRFELSQILDIPDVPLIQVPITLPLPFKKNRFRFQANQLWVDDLETPTSFNLISYIPKFDPPLSGRQVVIGQYIGTYLQSSTGFQPIGKRVYYIPVQIPYNLRLVEFSVYITTIDDDAQAKLGIYAFERGIIGKSIYNNTIALNTLGVRAVGANIVLGAGTYMFIYQGEVTAAQVKRIIASTTDPELTILGHARDDDGNQGGYYIEDKDNFSDLLEDNPIVTLEDHTFNIPHIFAKVG